MPASASALKKMSVAQKMAVMERVWDSLRDDETKVASPAWHRAELSHRKALHASGKATFSPWSTAKARIRKNARADSPL